MSKELRVPILMEVPDGTVLIGGSSYCTLARINEAGDMAIFSWPQKEVGNNAKHNPMDDDKWFILTKKEWHNIRKKFGW